MLGYVVFGTNDIVRPALFYDALVAEMGVSRLMEFGGRGYHDLNGNKLDVFTYA